MCVYNEDNEKFSELKDMALYVEMADSKHKPTWMDILTKYSNTGDKENILQITREKTQATWEA